MIEVPGRVGSTTWPMSGQTVSFDILGRMSDGLALLRIMVDPKLCALELHDSSDFLHGFPRLVAAEIESGYPTQTEVLFQVNYVAAENHRASLRKTNEQGSAITHLE